MSFTRLAAVCLVYMAGMHTAKHAEDSHLVQHRAEAEVKSILADVRRSQSVSDYIHRLQVYETFKKANMASGACFPAAPELSERHTRKTRAVQEKRCARGYRLGERHGQRWAQLIVRDGRSFAEGIELVRTLLHQANDTSIDLLPVCAFKGAKLSYTRWHQRYSSPAKMREYSQMKAEQPHFEHDSEFSMSSNDEDRQMTPKEMQFVKAVGTSDFTEAIIRSIERTNLN